ncbi:MAG TPA: hypothetical protein VGI92_02100 [Gemmatimonadales bacterium]|jgi:hypothetical protein
MSGPRAVRTRSVPAGFRVGGAAVALMMAACAGGPTPQRGAGSPALEPVSTWMDDRGSEGFVVMFKNNRREPTRITQIELFDCVNTSPSCGRVDPRLVLAPGQERDGLTVRPFDQRQAFSFHYRYTWAAETPAQARPSH